MKFLLLFIFYSSISISLAVSLSDFHLKLTEDIEADQLNDHQLHNRAPSRAPASVDSSGDSLTFEDQRLEPKKTDKKQGAGDRINRKDW